VEESEERVSTAGLEDVGAVGRRPRRDVRGCGVYRVIINKTTRVENIKHVRTSGSSISSRGVPTRADPVLEPSPSPSKSESRCESMTPPEFFHGAEATRLKARLSFSEIAVEVAALRLSERDRPVPLGLVSVDRVDERGRADVS
jgi:hypothetical protein